jgi:hypothetical protein
MQFNIGTPAFSSTSYLPYLIDGKDDSSVWNTELLLTNPGNTPVVFTVAFHANASLPGGASATLPSNGQTTMQSGQQYTIPANGAFYFVTAGDPNSSLVAGWAEVDSTAPIAGQAVLRRTVAGGTAVETAEQLVQSLTVFSFPYDLTMRSATQLNALYAFGNPATDSAASVTCTLDDLTGNAQLQPGTPAVFSININPGDQTAGSLNAQFYGRQGVANCVATLPVVPAIIRTSGTQALSLVPINGSN